MAARRGEKLAPQPQDLARLFFVVVYIFLILALAVFFRLMPDEVVERGTTRNLE